MITILYELMSRALKGMLRSRRGNTNTVLYKPVRFWDVLVWLILFALVLLFFGWLVKGG